MSNSPLIDAETLSRELGRADLVVIEASWYLPTEKRETHAEYLAQHIPGAVYFDLDGNSDHSSPYPHTLQSPEDFEATARRLGVRNDSDIVVYDSAGIFSAARVWWNFRLMGAKRVRVLDGGLKRWLALGLPVEQGEATRPAGDFVAQYHPELVRSFDEMLGLVGKPGTTIVDARGAPRFKGEVAEPRPGLASGHITGSRNVPFGHLITEAGTLRSDEAIAQSFAHAGVDIDGPLVTSCGSGVTAAILALGLAKIGREDVAVFDGSWSEWGARPESAGLIAKGEA